MEDEAQALLDLDTIPVLEELVSHTNEAVAKYAAGTLKNLMSAVASLPPDARPVGVTWD